MQAKIELSEISKGRLDILMRECAVSSYDELIEQICKENSEAAFMFGSMKGMSSWNKATDRMKFKHEDD
jgi:hypothetical protein